LRGGTFRQRRQSATRETSDVQAGGFPIVLAWSEDVERKRGRSRRNIMKTGEKKPKKGGGGRAWVGGL